KTIEFGDPEIIRSQRQRRTGAMQLIGYDVEVDIVSPLFQAFHGLSYRIIYIHDCNLRNPPDPHLPAVRRSIDHTADIRRSFRHSIDQLMRLLHDPHDEGALYMPDIFQL